MSLRRTGHSLGILFVPLVLAQACSDAAETKDDDALRDDNRSLGGAKNDANNDPLCPVGAESCACTEGGACDPGLSCVSTRCVDLDDEDVAGTGGESPHMMSATGGSSPDAMGGMGPVSTGGTNPEGPSNSFWSGCIHQTAKAVQAPEATLTQDSHLDYDVTRNGVPYVLHPHLYGLYEDELSYRGTSFAISTEYSSFGYLPQDSISYFPGVFCGALSSDYPETPVDCGLPAAISDLSELDTGLRWSPGGGFPAVRIVLGENGETSSFVDILLKRPTDIVSPLYQSQVMIDGVWAEWDIFVDQEPVGPVVSFVVRDGPVEMLSFDAMEFVHYARDRFFTEGDTVMGVMGGVMYATGDIEVLDFCAEPAKY